MRIHVLSTLCDVISLNRQGQLCSLTCAELRDLSNHTRMSTIQSRRPEKEAKNHVTLTWKSPWKSCSIAHLPFLSPNPKILKAFLKTIPTKMKPTKCPAREKKMRQESQKKRGGEKAKSKSQDCCVTFKPKNYVEILLSAHARTSQADILHLDQKAIKWTTCKPVCGEFSLFIPRQWPENHSTSFKMHFLAKSPGANGLMSSLGMPSLYSFITITTRPWP